MRTETAIAIIFLGVMGLIIVREVTTVIADKVIAYKIERDGNKRGWIGCENGVMWAKNFDLANDTFDMPEGHYVFDLDGRYCNENGRK